MFLVSEKNQRRRKGLLTNIQNFDFPRRKYSKGLDQCLNESLFAFAFNKIQIIAFHREDSR